MKIEAKVNEPFSKVVEKYIFDLECQNSILEDKLDDATTMINHYKQVLDKIKDAWVNGQPDHNGEVNCEVEDTCDAMYQLAVEAID